MASYLISSVNTNIFALLLCCFALCIGSRDGIVTNFEVEDGRRALNKLSAHGQSLPLHPRVPVALAASDRLGYDHIADSDRLPRPASVDVVESNSDFKAKTNPNSEFGELLGNKMAETENLPYDRKSPESKSAAEKKYSLEVTNDGPVIMGALADFTATLKELSGPQHDESTIHQNTDLFFYVWSGDSELLPQLMWNGNSCKLTIPFSSKSGNLNVKVTVWATDKILDKLAEANSTIRVTKTINGQILMSSTSYPECNTTDSHCSIPTKSNVSLIADIYDPSDYFESAGIIYKWNMGNMDVITTRSPVQVYSYQVAGTYNVTVSITAETADEERKYGFWHRNITVLAPLTNLTIESCSTSVVVGKREVVNVTCSGSPPVEICITVQEPGVPINATNTTCVNILTEKCFTTLTYHFDSSGEYVFQVAAKNNVSFLLNVSSIHAHPPSLPAHSITAITLAVIAGILMTSIGAMVFVQQVRKNRKEHVEVANFDFQFRDRSSSARRQKDLGWKWRPSKTIQLLNRTSSYYDSL